MWHRIVGAGLAVLVALAAAGCGRETKRENQRLKAQVAVLQQENLALKGDATTLKADAEAMRRQLDTVTKEKQALEEQVKEIEAKIAAQAKVKPPQKPKKMSWP
jgi:predicted nuclease with TOPRIM domain